MIDDERGCLDYEEVGTGPTAVLIPGSCSTGAAWRPVIAALGAGIRTVTSSLPGYGGSAERRGADHDIAALAGAVETVIARAGGPVHLVGHSFGALTCLVVALRGHAPLASLTIVEAPLPTMLESAGETEHHRAFRSMTDAYLADHAAGNRHAIAAMIDFYGGPGTWAAWPEKIRSYAVASTAVNIRDWASCYGYPLGPTALASLDLPTLVAYGERSHPSVQRANALVAAAIPRAQLAVVPGAAHFMPATHPVPVAALVRTHIERAVARPRSARP